MRRGVDGITRLARRRSGPDPEGRERAYRLTAKGWAEGNQTTPRSNSKHQQQTAPCLRPFFYKLDNDHAQLCYPVDRLHSLWSYLESVAARQISRAERPVRPGLSTRVPPTHQLKPLSTQPGLVIGPGDLLTTSKGSNAFLHHFVDPVRALVRLDQRLEHPTAPFTLPHFPRPRPSLLIQPRLHRSPSACLLERQPNVAAPRSAVRRCVGLHRPEPAPCMRQRRRRTGQVCTYSRAAGQLGC